MPAAKILVLIAIVMVVAVGAGVFILMPKISIPPPPSSTEPESETPTPTRNPKANVIGYVTDNLSNPIAGVTVHLGGLVQALVNDLIMPIIQLAVPGTMWEAIELGPFRVGHFIGALITFLIVVLVIFPIVKMTKKWGIE